MDQNMKNDIIKLIQSKPKHFSQMIKRNPEMVAFVEAHSEEDCKTFAEQVYQSVYGIPVTCPNGKRKKFKSAVDGYVFCGKAGTCACAKQAVSDKVKSAKANRTPEQIAAENDKRIQTNINVYGVENTGQLSHAKEAHTAFYQDESKVAEANRKNRASKLENHGDETYNNRDKAKETYKELYGVDNPIFLSKHCSNPNLSILRDKNACTELYNKHSVEEMAEMCDVAMDTVYYYTAHHGLRTRFRSEPEREIVNFLSSLGITNIVSNSRSLIPSRKELDIFLPDFNIAIEYNGLVWHHEDVQHIDKLYHQAKFIDCKNTGIQLLTIYGDSWANKRDIVKTRIIQKLGLCTDRIFARKTIIKEIPVSVANEFCDRYHIQGSCGAAFAYGLEYDGEIVSVMSFAKPRNSISKSKRKGNGYELLRLVSSTTVVGGASKLFQHFLKEKQPDFVISYSQNEWNTGQVYDTIGFKFSRMTSPGYWWINGSNPRHLLHRINFQKHKLVEEGYDEHKTETEIMKERGFLKLWDCGNSVWIWEKDA